MSKYNNGAKGAALKVYPTAYYKVHTWQPSIMIIINITIINDWQMIKIKYLEILSKKDNAMSQHDQSYDDLTDKMK